MHEGEQLRLRNLPDGAVHVVVVHAAQGRVIEVDLVTGATDCQAGESAELDSAETLYLGVIEHRQGDRLWVNVEHMIDRRILASIQAAWKQNGPGSLESDGQSD